MIPDVSVSVYGLVQFTITVITIQLVLVGFHYGLSFCLSYPDNGCGRHHRAVALSSPTKDKKSIPYFTCNFNRF